MAVNIMSFNLLFDEIKLIPGKIKNLINVFSKKSLSQKKHNMGL